MLHKKKIYMSPRAEVVTLVFEAPFLETSMIEMGSSTDHFDTQKRADDSTGDDNYWNSSAFEE
ncbi:MAG: hypothetical protein ACI3X6_04030 [Alloprevotella sp.]